VFAPDGKKLAWTSGRTGDGKAQIFLADWDDAAAREAIAQSPLRGTTTVAPSTDESFSPAISKSDLEHEIGWLADTKRDGRMTGTPGAQTSAQWIADYFHKIGLRPLGKNFFFPFEFNSGERVLPEKTALDVTTEGKPSTKAVLDKEFRPLSFSE